MPPSNRTCRRRRPLARRTTGSRAIGTAFHGRSYRPADADASAQTEDYASDAYFQDGQPAEHEDIYDDEPPPRRRVGIIAVAAVFALAIVGTAGAFGYRALFGSSGTHMPPPLIKADTAPSQGRPVHGQQGCAIKQADHRSRRQPSGREDCPARRTAGRPQGAAPALPMVPSPERCAIGAAGAGQWQRHRVGRAEENPHHHHSSGAGRHGRHRGFGAHASAAAGSSAGAACGSAGRAATAASSCGAAARGEPACRR